MPTPTNPPTNPTDEAGLIALLNSYFLQMQKDAGSVPFPVDVYRKDGSLDMQAAGRVLNSPEFADWRSSHQSDLAALNNDVKVFAGDQGLAALPTLIKTGIGVGQIKKGEKINANLPAYPQEIERNPNLQKYIAQADYRASRGFAPQELELARRQQQLGENMAYNRAVQGFGGQGGAAAAQYQAGANRNNDFALKLAQINQQARDAGLSQFGDAAKAQLSEDQRMQVYDAQRFANREIPLWQQNVTDRSNLIGAGLYNVVKGVDALSGQGRNMLSDFYTGGNNINTNIYPGAKQVMDAAKAADGMLNAQTNNLNTFQDQGYPKQTKGGFYDPMQNNY